jgi:hypothetical protein
MADVQLSPKSSPRLSPTQPVTLPESKEADSFDEDDVETESKEVKPWDEGGPSDCGYSETLHHTLMSVGEQVHALVGTPGAKFSSAQKSIGNWFQELSYTTRDILRGENQEDMQKDAADAIKTVMTGGLNEDNSMDEQRNEGEDV